MAAICTNVYAWGLHCKRGILLIRFGRIKTSHGTVIMGIFISTVSLFYVEVHIFQVHFLLLNYKL